MSSTSVNFDSFYDEIKTTLFNDFKNQCGLQTTVQRLEKVIDYNVPHGKKMRGMCTYEYYLVLCKNEASDDTINKAKALGWCIELLQSSMLVVDDIMDNAITRRGKPCWYLNKNVGNKAINDSFFLLFAVNYVIRKYLHDHPMYLNLCELFNEVCIQTTVGQALDLDIGTQDHNAEIFDFTKFTEENYSTIVRWKTAFYTFYLPIACTLYLANINSEHIEGKMKEILMQMGEYFQAQDDYLDCYGDPKVTGKIGTDIEEGKCSWLVVQALKMCNEEQLQILQENYGKLEPERVFKVKTLYNQLKIDEIFKTYETEQFNEINRKINTELNDFDDRFQLQIKQLLSMFVEKIFKRSS